MPDLQKSETQSEPTLPEIQQIPETFNRTSFILLPREVTLHVGDIFLTSVFAEKVIDMRAWQIELHFDPAIVECLNVSIPDQHVFFDDYTVSEALVDCNSTDFTDIPIQSVRNDRGYVLAGDCLLGMNQASFYGSGFLCLVAFKAISPGSSNLALPTVACTLGGTFCIDTQQRDTIPLTYDSSVIVIA